MTFVDIFHYILIFIVWLRFVNHFIKLLTCNYTVALKLGILTYLLSVTMLQQEVSTVEEFVYLGALIRSQLSRHPQTECIHAYSDAKP